MIEEWLATFAETDRASIDHGVVFESTILSLQPCRNPTPQTVLDATAVVWHARQVRRKNNFIAALLGPQPINVASD